MLDILLHIYYLSVVISGSIIAYDSYRFRDELKPEDAPILIVSPFIPFWNMGFVWVALKEED